MKLRYGTVTQVILYDFCLKFTFKEFEILIKLSVLLVDFTFSFEGLSCFICIFSSRNSRHSS